jgi:hypothetical protein
MNATLPAFVAYKFRKSKIVVFSSGNLYPIVPLSSGGCTEEDRPGPIGEYAQSCLARERAFEYAANKYGTPIFIYRLNFAVDLRYGVLFDVAKRIMDGEPISLPDLPTDIDCFEVELDEDVDVHERWREDGAMTGFDNLCEMLEDQLSNEYGFCINGIEEVEVLAD